MIQDSCPVDICLHKFAILKDIHGLQKSCSHAKQCMARRTIMKTFIYHGLTVWSDTGYSGEAHLLISLLLVFIKANKNK